MKKIRARSILRSAQRLVEGADWYEATGTRFWLLFMRRESTILLRRAFKLWLRLRFRPREPGKEIAQEITDYLKKRGEV